MSSLLIHTCDVIEAGTKTSYGRTTPDFEPPAQTTRGVPCHWQPEAERDLATGALLSSHLLVVRWDDAPASLQAAGAEAKHRIANIKRAGVLVDAGPFLVQGISDAGGLGRHLEIQLLRAS